MVFTRELIISTKTFSRNYRMGNSASCFKAHSDMGAVGTGAVNMGNGADIDAAVLAAASMSGSNQPA